MGKSHKKKRTTKKPYNKTKGFGKNKRGSVKGNSFSAKYAQPLVHRSIRSDAYVWPLNGPGLAPGLAPLRVLVPEKTWGQYTRGFDIPQVTSNGVRSRNCTMRVRIQLPKAGAAAQPYQLRIVQCWIKTSIEAPLTSTAGTSGMFDGLVLNFNPDTAWDARAHTVFSDSVGNTNGDGSINGNISTDRIKVLEDSVHTMASSNVDSAGAFVYPTYDRLFNFKTMTNMRLYPTTDGAAIPADPANIKLCPVNNQRLWIPCVAMMILNAGDYIGAADQPGVSVTESHYWTCL